MAQLAMLLRAGPYIAILLLLAYAARLNDLRDRHAHMYQSEHAGRLADRATYEAAQKQAEVLNDKQIQRIRDKQESINAESVSDLERRLELIRRELRNSGTAAPQGIAGSPEAGGTVATPCRTPDPSWLCLSPEERLHAAENEERHDQLITAAEKQAGIDPNR